MTCTQDLLRPTCGRVLGLAIVGLLCTPTLHAQIAVGVPGQEVLVDPVPTNPSPDSDRFAVLFPSRVKTFVKASYDPDDRLVARYQGNDDGFSGTNLCESYRTTDAGNSLAVLAHFEGRPGVLGLFFRNFWSDSGGVPMLPGENNRTRFWLDGQLRHDLPLWDCFRNENDPRGQVAPFHGPFTGRRSGGHVTHAQLRWNHSFRLGLWDDQHTNAARFHRVAATIGSPEGELPVPDMAGWEWIAQRRGQWPHQAPRVPRRTTLQVPANRGTAALQLTGPSALLELGFEVAAHQDWDGLWARFTFDHAGLPQVETPLRLLGAMVAPPHRFPVNSLLFANDGDRRIVNWFPMPFAQHARLELVNRNPWPVAVQVTWCEQRGPYPQPWGWFHALYHGETTGTGEPFQGPRLANMRGTLRMLLLEDRMDDTGRIPDMHTTHLEGDLCVRINGNRGEDHNFDASETSIGRWGWYLTPADQPFVADTSFQSSILSRRLPGGHLEAQRIMGSTFVFDPIHFVDGIDIVLEHGIQNLSNADYGLLAFLYAEPGAARRTVAEIDIGNPTSEAAHQVQFTAWATYTRAGSYFRDQFFGTNAVVDSVRHVRDFLRFRVVRPGDVPVVRPYAVGFRLDRLGGQSSTVCQADVFVDGQPAGVLHSFTHSSVYPWKEGGECEVELPRALTDGKAAFTVEVRPRAGTDPLRIARAWVYEYTK